MASQDRTPRIARPFVVGFITLMVLAALFVWEPWPFTSYRLFSQLRTNEQTAWVVKATDATGLEEDLPLSDELRGFEFQIREFVQASAERKDELCSLWAGAAPGIVGRPTKEVRLYRRTWRLSEREGDRALPGRMELSYVCTTDGASDVG